MIQAAQVLTALRQLPGIAYRQQNCAGLQVAGAEIGPQSTSQQYF